MRVDSSLVGQPLGAEIGTQVQAVVLVGSCVMSGDCMCAQCSMVGGCPDVGDDVGAGGSHLRRGDVEGARLGASPTSSRVDDPSPARVGRQEAVDAVRGPRSSASH